MKWCLAAFLPVLTGLALAADVETPTLQFQRDCAARAQAAGDDLTVPGRDGWLFLAAELRHIGAGPFWGPDAAKVSRAEKAELQDPLPAILDYRDALKKAGIELFLMPVPPKSIIYPDMISNTIKVEPGQVPPRLDASLQKFYAVLRENGVRVIDLTDEFLRNRLETNGPLYCKTDSHWSGIACVRAARRAAADIRTELGLKTSDTFQFRLEERTTTIKGDLLIGLKSPPPDLEKIWLRFVRLNDAPQETLEDLGERGPFILLGDSHGLVFHAGGDMLAKDAGLADQLAVEMGFPFDVVAVRGSGARPARLNLFRRARKEGYLKGKKALLWCFSAREFTEADGWGKVPLVLEP